MGSNTPVISGSQVPQGSPLWPIRSGGPIVLPSNKSCSSPVNSDIQGSTGASGPLCQHGLLPFQDPPRSQDSPREPRKQRKKRTVFTQEQKLVLQEHFEKCVYLNQEQRMALAQRFGLKEANLKIWFKNRRAREKKKKAQEVPGKPGCGSHDRPTCREGSVPLVTSASADSLCLSPELQKHPSSVSKLRLQMSQSSLLLPGTLMQSSLQWHSDPERNLVPHVSPGPSVKPHIPMHPGSPTLGTQTVNLSHQMPSSSSVSSGSECSLGPTVPSDKYGDQQVQPEAPRKQRKERTVYSKEQKLLLQEHFDHCMYPSLEQRLQLAEMIGVSQYEIKIWFKNQRAKYKQNNPQNAQKGLSESCGSSKVVSGSTHSRGLICPCLCQHRVHVSRNICCGLHPQTHPSLEAYLHDDRAMQDAGCTPQKDLFDGQAPAAAPKPGQPTVVETQTDPAMTEDLASVKAPVPTTAAARGPDDAHHLYPTSKPLWQCIRVALDTWEDL